jgi:hypothetical protein
MERGGPRFGRTNSPEDLAAILGDCAIFPGSYFLLGARRNRGHVLSSGIQLTSYTTSRFSFMRSRSFHTSRFSVS